MPRAARTSRRRTAWSVEQATLLRACRRAWLAQVDANGRAEKVDVVDAVLPLVWERPRAFVDLPAVVWAAVEQIAKEQAVRPNVQQPRLFDDL